ncbi:MAG: hypothetical protein CUN57_03515, partial [Phototrophicales bacterium]
VVIDGGDNIDSDGDIEPDKRPFDRRYGDWLLRDVYFFCFIFHQDNLLLIVGMKSVILLFNTIILT